MKKIKHYLNKLLKYVQLHKIRLAIIFVLALLIVTVPMAYTYISTKSRRYDLDSTPIQKIPYNRVGIVFGAGIYPNGQPSPYLQFRLETAIKLFKAHRVDILLMSGDNSTKHHNEPRVMSNYAIKHGVPKKDVVVDDAGFDTYDTCYRAHYLFGLTRATLISQAYHLPRAITTCSGLGIKSIGVIAVHPIRSYTISYILREFLSTDKMVIDLTLKPKPAVLGKPLPL